MTLLCPLSRAAKPLVGHPAWRDAPPRPASAAPSRFAPASIIKVPLNSPDPIESIRRLASDPGPATLVGAGTVTAPADVEAVVAAAVASIVMPHADVGGDPRGQGCRGRLHARICTPTEGFAALAAGADALKLFPAELVAPSVLRAMASVFPRAGTRFLPVGGIAPDTMAPYTARRRRLRLGSALYKPGMSGGGGRPRRRLVGCVARPRLGRGRQ